LSRAHGALNSLTSGNVLKTVGSYKQSFWTYSAIRVTYLVTFRERRFMPPKRSASRGRADFELVIIIFYTEWIHGTITGATPCGLRGWKKRPAPFPGRMSWKATKPGSVCPLS